MLQWGNGRLRTQTCAALSLSAVETFCAQIALHQNCFVICSCPRFTRFPYHVDPSVRPEQLLSTQEQIVIANPRLVDFAVLGDVVVRQEAPLYSNLLDPLETCSPAQTKGEFAGSLMQRRTLDPWKWRANHYVLLYGRSVVFRVEEF